MLRAPLRWLPLTLLVASLCGVATGGCGVASYGSGLEQVPAVPKPPKDIAGLTILIRSDPKIVVEDPVVQERVERRKAGPRFRQAMESALAEAGYVVVHSAERPHDIEMQMILEAVGSGDEVQSKYRLDLYSEGERVTEVLWIWPRGEIVALDEIHDYGARKTLAAMYDSKELADFVAGRSESRRRKPAASSGGLGIASPKSSAVAVAPPTDERRVALVIGNGAYRGGRLANPVHDARAMAAALRQLGFAVTERSDLDQKQMKLAIRAFGRKLHGGGVGLFYYAGHGAQVGGQNYLIPLGADIPSEDHVDVESVPLRAVLAEIADAGNRLNLVILDACRNNPFARRFRSLQRGLAFVDAPQGTLIAYATAPGAVADDGTGQHGAYTEALVRHIRTPGVPVESVFKAVRRDVQSTTAGRQTPWESSSLTGEFSFAPKTRPKQ
ncbi:MAG: caspase family protein [Deltaproteobacteria bacterium]|jgi:hypothetical protein|nr:caspase family protein [Deltaproteobacteria bacterium]MBW2530453.1 caspase family protein [Deltaproteobacteria bacterium]